MANDRESECGVDAAFQRRRHGEDDLTLKGRAQKRQLGPEGRTDRQKAQREGGRTERQRLTE